MPKWLSSLLIAIGFLALIVLAVLPRNVEVEVTVTSNNIQGNSTVHKTVNHNGPVALEQLDANTEGDEADDSE